MALMSWNWLTPRGTLRHSQVARGPSAPSRPCLPQIEQLGDRVMLSADASIIIKGELTAEQVLIGLLKTQLQPAGEQPSLLSSELAALKIASLLAADSHKLVADTVKLTHEFLKIDNIFYKFGEALIKGDLTEDVANKALSDLTDTFLKLDGIVQDIGGAGENNLLLPAGRGRDGSCLPPPAQIPACGTTAPGSCLG